MKIELKLPAVGEGIERADVVAILFEVGQALEGGEQALELETGKAVMELPCPHAGTVVDILVEVGRSVQPGAVLLVVEGEGVSEAPAPAATPPAPASQTSAPAPAQAPSDPPAPTPAPSASAPHRRSGAPAPAGPATRRLARQLGVDLREVRGTARGGRITREDVKDHVKARMTSAPVVAVDRPTLPDFRRWGEIERERLSAVRKATVASMSRSWSLIPHVTQLDEADITEIEAARERFNASRRGDEPKLTMTVLVLKALAATLRAMPRFNASLDEGAEELVLKRYVNLGVAVDTPHGLLVPVLRDVDRKSALQVARELDEMAGRARDRKLKSDELQGATFTLSNLGGLGGTGFTPIVNWPEVAILGLSRGAWRYGVTDDGPVARLFLPLSLSYDHRVIDGADAVRFTRRVAQLLQDPIRLMLEV